MPVDRRSLSNLRSGQLRYQKPLWERCPIAPLDDRSKGAISAAKTRLRRVKYETPGKGPSRLLIPQACSVSQSCLRRAIRTDFRQSRAHAFRIAQSIGGDKPHRYIRLRVQIFWDAPMTFSFALSFQWRTKDLVLVHMYDFLQN